MIWRIRSLLFNLTFYGSTLILLGFLVPLWLAPRSWQRRVPPVWLAVVYFCERYILGLDYKVIGLDNLPPPPYIAAMKHQSAWETMKLYRLYGHPAIILKKELMDLPLWGQYAKAMDMVPIDRSKGRQAIPAMVESAKQVLIDKRPLVVFPQGTRIKPGVKAPYKIGVMKLYEALNIPLVPIAINAGIFWSRNSFWKRPGTVTIEILPAIPPGQDSEKVFAQLEELIENTSDRLAFEAVKQFRLEKDFPKIVKQGAAS